MKKIEVENALRAVKYFHRIIFKDLTGFTVNADFQNVEIERRGLCRSSFASDYFLKLVLFLWGVHC